jgi:hypothetical protein
MNGRVSSAIVFGLLVAAAGPVAGERWTTDAAGRVVVSPGPLEAEWRNEWPSDWEEAFIGRTNASLRASDVQPGKYGGTFFENEKASYPAAFIGLLKGQRAEARAFLQQDDDAAWSRELTLGVDWFPAFTLRGQTRKYFFFGDVLDPDYRRRMAESAKIWTAVDPLGRANPFWLTPQQRRDRGLGGEGWTPEFHNSWVDIRGTDNLRVMREQGIFLMAEETGQAAAAAAAKSRLRAYVDALYATGMPEWDSANYLNHALTAWLPLYDFARDREVTAMAKAALDFLSASAAVKYFRGSWAGPSLRDYGNVGPHAGAAGEFWHYFGDLDAPARAPYRDFVHVMTSAYRPPAAVVELARRRFPRPAEILASKPSYTGWQRPGGESEPAYFETTWIGHHSQLGSLPNGHADPPGMNLNGFRLLAENSTRGADTVIVFTSLDWNHSHATATLGGDQIAQCRSALVWMNPRPDARFFLFLPRSAAILPEADGRVFVRLEKTWLALHLIRARAEGIDATATAKACGPRKPDEAPRFPDDHVWAATGAGTGPCGFALEIGEPETHGSFAAFRDAVATASGLDLPAPDEARFTAANGDRAGLRLTPSGRPEVFRDGRRHEWHSHWALWGGDSSPIRMGWKDGTLRVTAGGREFSTSWPPR